MEVVTGTFLELNEMYQMGVMYVLVILLYGIKRYF
jgi:hypothetical protein